jgi:hypothetical protein
LVHQASAPLDKTALRFADAYVHFFDGAQECEDHIPGFIVLLHLYGPEARSNSKLYGAAQSRDQAAVLLMADLYLNRERQVDRVLSEKPAYELLLTPYRSMIVTV